MLGGSADIEKGQPFVRMTKRSECATVTGIMQHSATTTDRPYHCCRCHKFFPKDDGYFTGREPKGESAKQRQFKCKACNKMDGRIMSIKKHSGSKFLEAWELMSGDSLAKFMETNAELQKEALARAMTVAVQQIKVQHTSTHTHTNTHTHYYFKHYYSYYYHDY